MGLPVMTCLGTYIPGNSFLHRLDPRVKIAATAVLGTLVFGGGWPGLIVVSALFSAVTVTCRFSGGEIIRAMKPLAVFAILLFAMHTLFSPGSSLSAAIVTTEGILTGLFVAWQYLALVYGGLLLTVSTAPTDLVAALARLLAPLRRIGVPVQDVALMVSLAFRFLPLLAEEYERIVTAQATRGADQHGATVAVRIRLAYLRTQSLTLGVLRKADELATAVEARGYGVRPGTTLRVFTLGRADYAALLVVFSIAATVIVTRLTG